MSLRAMFCLFLSGHFTQVLLSKRPKIGLQYQFSLNAGQKLPFIIKTYVLSIFEWPFYTGLTFKKPKVDFNANSRLMQIKSTAECSTGSILQWLLTFIKLPFVIKAYVLSILSGRFTQVLL